MSYYKTRPHCGAHLDPGEACDCRPAPVSKALRLIMGMTEDECAAVLEAVKAAQGAANALDGKVEQTLTGPVSASHDIREMEDLQA